DYRAQAGQILPYVARPPTGKLNMFNLYVALSRSAGQETIRLLTDFDVDVFKQSHDAYLIQEDERLEGLDKRTHEWWDSMRTNFILST
ncbi:hypothetical protein NEOLEDRAFT_1055830, partial [Neolentinus lepideus HHB14362 ss-1]